MAVDIKDLTRGEYELFRKLVYNKSGINLGDQKMQLVRARLGKRLREKGMGSFKQYYDHVVDDPSGEELCGLLDSISTNTTHLFREPRHFDFLKKMIAQWASDTLRCGGEKILRVWSAACSSGEEPYSIAMLAQEALREHPGFELKILATDISIQMLSKAKLGLFEAHRVGTVPPALKNRYLVKKADAGGQMLQIAPELRKVVTFARFNLMSESFPFRHGFHVIFCRNVMIYFDRPTQEALVNKFATHLQVGGYLLIGHSESLNGVEHPLAYVEPTIYRKK